METNLSDFAEMLLARANVRLRADDPDEQVAYASPAIRYNLSTGLAGWCDYADVCKSSGEPTRYRAACRQ
jgi:hypothetical protein